MRKSYLIVVFVCCALVAVIGCSKPAPVTEAEAEVAMDTVAADVAMEEADAAVRNDVLFVCNCGPDCTCKSVSTEAGTCTCGKELAAAHMVKVEGNEALLCTCGGDCTCAINADDETKCACGSDVRRVSLEGSGLYYCNCGGSCTCNFVSDEPGTCSCGMELVTS
jgi:hypothetical protein